MKRPLAGKVVVVTRPRKQAIELIASLESSGAKVVAAPVIKIAPPASYAALDGALRLLASFDGILFTSRNAVDRFFERARILKLKPRPPRVLFAVGSETAAALAKRGWKAKAPKVHRGEALARALGDVRGLRLLIPRAKEAREVLPAMLRRRGAKVVIAEAYRTVADPEGRKILRRAAKDSVAAVTFTSGSTVDQFFKLLGRPSARRLLETAAAISIGPVTSASLRAHGIRPAAQARKATARELAKAVVRAAGGVR